MREVAQPGRRVLATILLVGLVLLAWTYRATILSVADKWRTDAAFSHGYLILPIVLWLVWRKRGDLAAIRYEPSWTGAVAVVTCAAAWIVARGTGVLVVEQLSVVAMVPALVLAVLGNPAARVLGFPLAFLCFLVPFGRGIVPWLMQATADMATLGLHWTGVPVLRSNMFISIPAGTFEVARACSGLNYFITGLVLGVLYAYLNYHSVFKRILCIAAFAVIPILMNGLRVYFTILVSHLTDMRFGPGYEHVTFGRIFFVVVMLAMFWIGRRWHDDPADSPRRDAPVSGAAARVRSGRVALCVAFVALAAGPMFLASTLARARAQLVDRQSLVGMPAAPPGWTSQDEISGRWRPMYQGGVVERQGLYLDPDGGPVDVFVAVYGLGTSTGAEMISYNNAIDSSEQGSLKLDRTVSVPVGGRDGLKARELVVEDAHGERLVWQWFVVGDRPAAGPFAAKALEAVAFIARDAASERIVVISTPNDAGAAERLNAFARANGSCISNGFSSEACKG